MKKKTAIIWILVTVAVVGIAAVCVMLFMHRYSVTDNKVEIYTDSIFEKNKTTNLFQSDGYYDRLFEYKGKLYCILDDFKRSSTIFKIESGKTTKVCSMDGRPIFKKGRYLYYTKYLSNNDVSILYNFDFETEKNNYMGPFDERGSVYRIIPTFGNSVYLKNDKAILKINDGAFRSVDRLEEKYKVNGAEFTISSVSDGGELLYSDGAVQKKIEIEPLYYNFVPANEGLLFYRQSGIKDSALIYYIDQKGVVKSLLKADKDCYFTDMSLAVYNNKVFCSIERFEEGGFWGHKRIEKDDISGTYVISLNDYSIKKISDDVYDAFYVFDNTGLYVIRDNDILKIDYDGNIVDEIVNFYY